MRLLLIEDERKVADFIARGLRAERFAVDVAYDGTSGWEMASTIDYDLLILDLMLPGMVALHVTIQPLHQGERIGLVGLNALVQFVPVLRPDDDVGNPHRHQRAVQTVAQRARFVAAVNLFGQVELLLGPGEKLLGLELLRRLGSGVVDLPDHPIAVGMNVDAQLDALGFGNGLCCSRTVGIGVCFHNLV
jgi:CheY-like chemotaxis protein